MGIPGGDGGDGLLLGEQILADSGDCAVRQHEEREKRVQGQPMAAAAELNKPCVLKAEKTLHAAAAGLSSSE